MEPRGIADELIVARRERKAIPPFTDAYPLLDTGRAYAAQALVVAHRLDGGERLVGAKLGLTSRVKREALGIDQPVYGWLTSGMVLAHGEPVPVGELIHPRAEPEIALILRDPPAAPATVASVLAATEAVYAAIEVVDSRYRDFRFRLADSIADNAGAAFVVLGSRVRRPHDLEDLRLVGCVFRSQGEVVGTAAGAAVLGHPAAAVAWLVNTLALQGRQLEGGTVVLTGGLTGTVPLRSGHVASAEFDELGSVEVYC
jgi:2-oxo-3-hexenedioate decarboxylase